MKKIFQFLMMASVSLMATSCYYDQLPAVPVPDTISYSKDVQSLWDKNCTGCHGVGATSPDLTAANSYTDLTTGGYVVAGNAAASLLYKCLIGNGGPVMPTNGKMSADKIATVEKWINDGALNN